MPYSRSTLDILTLKSEYHSLRPFSCASRCSTLAFHAVIDSISAQYETVISTSSLADSMPRNPGCEEASSTILSAINPYPLSPTVRCEVNRGRIYRRCPCVRFGDRDRVGRPCLALHPTQDLTSAGCQILPVPILACCGSDRCLRCAVKTGRRAGARSTG